MKFLFLMGLCLFFGLFLVSCDNGASLNRGYVISQSQIEPEQQEEEL